MRVVFMGTPDIAAGILRALIASRHEVVGVVTQPDKPNARGNEVIFSDVKKVALEYEIPVLQPLKASSETSVEAIKELAPDIIVVVAYGQILKENLLSLPKYRCINVHASLLPKYRGASPIQWAIINGEERTGVSIMYMDKGIDTGDVVLTRELTLAPDETAGSLYDRLTELGGPALLDAMDMIEEGTANPVKQDDSAATYVAMLTKSMGNLDFNRPAEELERLVRGLIPWPGAYTYIEGRMIKFFKVRPTDKTAPCSTASVPGRVFTLNNRELYIETSAGSLQILELQPEGKRRMPTEDFLRGCRLTDGTIASAER